jgi:multiple sugar transport system permease protein
MAITSIKSNSELLDHTKNPLFVLQPNLQNYLDLFSKTNFIRWTINSAVVAATSTTISLVCSVLAGYSLARLRYRGATAIGWGVFVTYLVPPTLLFLPLAFVIAQLHLFNSYWSLILTYPTFLIPFCTWLLMGYFRGIPRELEEAALVDGASRLQAMVRVVIPLALPGILSAGMFAFTLSWGEFLYALVFMSDTAMKTIPVGVVNELIKGDEFYWGELMAAALLGSVPVALLYSFFVDYFVAGMTAGAVKG